MANLGIVVVWGGCSRGALVVEIGLRWPPALLWRRACRWWRAPPPAFSSWRHGRSPRRTSIDDLHQSPVTSHFRSRRDYWMIHAMELKCSWPDICLCNFDQSSLQRCANWKNWANYAIHLLFYYLLILQLTNRSACVIAYNLNNMYLNLWTARTHKVLEISLKN